VSKKFTEIEFQRDVSDSQAKSELEALRLLYRETLVKLNDLQINFDRCTSALVKVTATTVKLEKQASEARDNVTRAEEMIAGLKDRVGMSIAESGNLKSRISTLDLENRDLSVNLKTLSSRNAVFEDENVCLLRF
jgi:chromosome segregation ATPase